MRTDYPGVPGLTAEEARVAANAVRLAIAVAIMAVSAQLAVPLPFTPVPMTLQPVAVLAIGALLGRRMGLAALVAYLAVGMAGLPVFSLGRGGTAHLFGPTGGYLLAFPIAAWVAALGGTRRLRTMIPAMVGAMVTIHAGGAAWLAILGGNAAFAWDAGFVPFLTGDLMKIGLAASIVLLLAPKARSGR
jgi:biotin transport system substrate-specific component